MQEFEIRVLNENKKPSLIVREIYLSASSAIRAGCKLAQDKPFEVWRGDECVYDMADSNVLQFPLRKGTDTREARLPIRFREPKPA
jgi:hypothetical protein